MSGILDVRVTDGTNPLSGVRVFAQPRTTIPIPPSIASDGSRDISAELLTWLLTVPDGAVVQFSPTGRYWVERGLRIGSTPTLQHLTLDGGGHGSFDHGAELFVTAPGQDPHGTIRSGRRVLYGIGFASIAFRGFRARGVNYFGAGGWLSQPSMAGPGFGEYFEMVEFEHSFAFANCQQGLIENCSSYGMFGDCVYFAGCRNITVRNVLGDSNGRQGLATNDTRGILIDGLTLLHGRRSFIDLENNIEPQVIQGVEIRNCNSLSRLLAFTSGGPGDCSDVEIHHNTVRGSGDPTVNNGDPSQGRTTRRRNWNVHHNTFEDERQGPSSGFQFYLTDNIAVAHNTLRFSVHNPAVTFRSCGGALSVTDNVFRGASAAYLAESSGPVVESGNTF